MTRRITVFVSSPSDVDVERRLCGEVVEELNSTLRLLVPEKDTQLELMRWETHTYPDVGAGPQAAVDEQIPVDYDIYLGIMWARFGTPTDDAGSGTESEFRAARRGWKNHGRPSNLMFFFCNRLSPTLDARELVKVQRFRNKLMQQGLVGFYDTPEDFAAKLRRSLMLLVSKMLEPPSGAPQEDTLDRLEAVQPSTADLQIVREQLQSEADSYVAIRQEMRAGEKRTQKMELIASQLKSLSQSAWPLLRELKANDHPGLRLAAICALEATASIDHVDWLADRLDPQHETPFVGYHAAIALLTASRDLPEQMLPPLAQALERAIRLAEPEGQGTDRMVTLRAAQRETRRRLRPVQPD